MYAKYLSDKGIKGILVNGTTGEGTSMSVAERKKTVETWVSHLQNQHLMVQIGGAPLPDVIELAKHAESVKADSILCLPELYFKPQTPAQLIEYLKTISEAAPNTPLLYYHIPMFTNVNIDMGQFLESVKDKIPTFVGIKFTSNDLVEAKRALSANNGKYVIFLGSDHLMNAAHTLGIDSFIATSINMFPELAVAIIKANKTGDNILAKKKQDELSAAINAISIYGNWVETMKTAMDLRTSIQCGPPRAPLKPLPKETVQSMLVGLKVLGHV